MIAAPARHGHHEVPQQRAQRQVLMAGAVGDDRAVGLSDERRVAQHAVVGVQLAARAQRDGVQAALRARQLDAVADAERAAGSLASCGPAPSLRSGGRGRTATSSAVRPSSVGQTACAPAPAIDTMSGTPITAAPEATAERRPFGESSIATLGRA